MLTVRLWAGLTGFGRRVEIDCVGCCVLKREIPDREHRFSSRLHFCRVCFLSTNVSYHAVINVQNVHGPYFKECASINVYAML